MPVAANSPNGLVALWTQQAIAVLRSQIVNDRPSNEHLAAVATHARPGCFPLGSVESRAAARALVNAKTHSSRLQPEFYEAVVDPLDWLQRHTRTRDTHWRESGARRPYRSFPGKPDFPVPG